MDITPPRTILGDRSLNKQALLPDAQVKNNVPSIVQVQKTVTTNHVTLSKVRDNTSSRLSSPDKSASYQTFLQLCKERSVNETLENNDQAPTQEAWCVEDFEIVRRLGSGAVANVYLAYERISRHPVALKVQVYDPDDVTADNELDIHLPLQHRNVVRLYDYFFSGTNIHIKGKKENDDTEDNDDQSTSSSSCYLYMILDVCDRGSLFDIMEEPDQAGWLDEFDAMHYFRQCIESLQYIHTPQGDTTVVHCDVKTSNFLVQRDGTVQLADFGMAVQDRSLEDPEDSFLQYKEVWGGSPVYMAPEHLKAWRSGSGDFDARVDIYGLGVVLFQILSGEMPFFVIQKGDDLEEMEDLWGYFNVTGEDGDEFVPPKLDLRWMDDKEGEEDIDFVLPDLVFPERISMEARDLIQRLMDPDRDTRITLAKALEHPWFQTSIVDW